MKHINPAVNMMTDTVIVMCSYVVTYVGIIKSVVESIRVSMETDIASIGTWAYRSQL